MAWLWWLMAPLVMTAIGGLTLSWRDRRASRFARRDPVLAHAELLSALARFSVPAERPRQAPVPQSGGGPNTGLGGAHGPVLPPLAGPTSTAG